MKCKEKKHKQKKFNINDANVNNTAAAADDDQMPLKTN